MFVLLKGFVLGLRWINLLLLGISFMVIEIFDWKILFIWLRAIV